MFSHKIIQTILIILLAIAILPITACHADTFQPYLHIEGSPDGPKVTQIILALEHPASSITTDGIINMDESIITDESITGDTYIITDESVTTDDQHSEDLQEEGLITEELQSVDFRLEIENSPVTVSAIYLSDSLGNPVEAGSQSSWITIDIDGDVPSLIALDEYGMKYYPATYRVSISDPDFCIDGTCYNLQIDSDCISYRICPDVERFNYRDSFTGEYQNPMSGELEKQTIQFAAYEPEPLSGGAKNPLIIWLHGFSEGGQELEMCVLGSGADALAKDPIQSQFITPVQSAESIVGAVSSESAVSEVSSVVSAGSIVDSVSSEGAVSEVSSVVSAESAGTAVSSVSAGTAGDESVESGTANTDVDTDANVTVVGSYVLIPQCPTYWMDEGDAEHYTGCGVSMFTEALKDLIDEYLRHNPDVDARRIYIGGASNGAYMTMNMLCQYPEMFAAAFPVCGGYSYYKHSRDEDGHIQFAASEETGEVEGTDGIEEPGEAEGADVIEEPGEVEGADGIEETGEVEGADGIEETGEVEGTDGIEETGEAEGTDGIEETGEAEGADGIEETGEAEGTDEIEEADRIDEIGENKTETEIEEPMVADLQGALVTNDIFFTQGMAERIKDIPIWFISSYDDGILAPWVYILPDYCNLIHAGAEHCFLSMFSTYNHSVWVPVMKNEVTSVQDVSGFADLPIPEVTDASNDYYPLEPTDEGGGKYTAEGCDNLFAWLNGKVMPSSY